jgi:hypothetical protein
MEHIREESIGVGMEYYGWQRRVLTTTTTPPPRLVVALCRFGPLLFVPVRVGAIVSDDDDGWF